MSMKNKIARKEFILQVTKQQEKLSLTNRLRKFFIASAVMFVLAIPFVVNDHLKRETNIDLIERIDSQRKISRTLNTFNFTRDKADYDFYSNYYASYSEVRSDLVGIIAVKQMQPLWTKEMIDNTAHMLVYFNNDNSYMIDWRLALAIFAHESGMNPYKVSVKNSDGTRDFGIGQNNSGDIDRRFAIATVINRRLNLVDPKLVSTNRLNLYAGVITTMMHLKEDRDAIVAHNRRNPRYALGPDNWIVGYNTGFNGMMNGMYRKAYVERIESNIKTIVEL